MSGSSTVAARALPGEAADRLRGRAAELFVEVQRADSKATALCGLAGGLLAVVIAALSALGDAAWVVKVALASACGLLGAALVAALLAIRPVLPRGRALMGVEIPSPDGGLEALVAALAAMSREEQLRADALQVTRLALLAYRKFRAIRVAVDLTASALGMAGIGLLIPYITS
ncbi:hypothetical protein CUT44_13815 [Streptomyces carminius]|uniref:Pycsar effector protein domain-containing protein n=1 Tax=Streptomyces carminius TaxID=2665496 RepID=A0A2M8LZ58_9ACTN|nr:Pycsar system effector family protein [Streptomyces carminius]PJE97214.1 hypothetical protein CUT44_13815 [Streptomyces carminius]